MKTTGIIAAAAASTLLLSGCGGGTSSEAAPATPKTVSVTVTMQDDLPLTLLYNGGGGQCTSVNLGAALTGGTSAPVTLELRNASGTLIGSQKLPKVGGKFSKASGCTWAVTFDDVPAGDLFSAKVTDGTQQFQGSGPAAGLSITL